MTDKRVVLVTCASEEEASRIARALVHARLAACVSILQSPVVSVYRWKGRIQTSTEHLLLIKTHRARLRTVEAAVKRLHSYDVPEFIALPVSEGSRDYLAWMKECLSPIRVKKVQRR
jgi:periplasmic divalent cation tolerance protein